MARLVVVKRGFTCLISGLTSLKYIDLSYNHLTQIGEGSFARGQLPSLVGIRLDHNSIVEVRSGSFHGLRNLETIIMNKNGIRNIKSGTIAGLDRFAH